MANQMQLEILRQGLESWNQWRKEHPNASVDFANADLRKINISLMPSLRDADAKGLIPPGSSWAFIANEIVGYDVLPLDLSQANLRGTLLSGVDLRCANCSGSDFTYADLSTAQLGRANLSDSRFVETNLQGANLRGADLSRSVLVKTNLTDTDFGYSRVYGVSVWDIVGTPIDEENLIVTPKDAATLSIDSLSLSQFLYLLIKNENAREAIDTITTKVVLILGNFRKERKMVLDAIRDRLRNLNLIPVMFDFDAPTSKDITGTVETLARLSRFVIADLTDPSSIPHELATTVPFLRTTPVLLLRLAGTDGYSMINDLMAYKWVLDVYEYDSASTLIEQIPEVIEPACILADKLQRRKS